ncbi:MULTISPECIES: hypothetical protein [Pseudomonas]|uniref:Uncharacterized protein n=1 Tax=Pseudomonas kribbensis TaxID=1628086 RepID=A0A4Y8VGN7_9PSED|nr:MULTISPECIES: hypothetical protein [Pseudomonas]TFH78974.1 hypothetical protein E4J90_18490 [Pseudomonas kribbensis]
MKSLTAISAQHGASSQPTNINPPKISAIPQTQFFAAETALGSFQEPRVSWAAGKIPDDG